MYHVKTPETMLNIAILIGERWKKSQELYSREGDNTSRFERKTVALEHTIQISQIRI